MIRFGRVSRAALVSDGQNNQKKTWYGSSVLNTGVAKFGRQIHLYFRGPVGNDDNRHAVGRWRQNAAGFEVFSRWDEDANYVLHPDNIDLADSGLSWNPSAARRLTNPEACVFKGELYLYTIVKGIAGSGVGIDSWSPTLLWKSSDGERFFQAGFLTDANEGYVNTIHTGGLGVAHDGKKFIMVSSTLDNDGFGYGKVVRTSTDGLHWSAPYDQAFPMPNTILDRDFDDESWVTARLFIDDDHVYAFIPGGGMHEDYPEGIGLWRQKVDQVSTDPWDEYPHNPVLLRGGAGAVDEGAVWSPSVIKVDDRLHMFYEGCGAYSFPPGSPESDQARDDAYGGYGISSFSSICYATMNGDNLATKWVSDTLMAGHTYRLRNMMDGSRLHYAGVLDGDRVGTSLNPKAANLDWILDRDNEFWVFRCSKALSQVLEVPKSSRQDRAECEVRKHAKDENRQQEWHVEETNTANKGDRICFIQNRHSGLYLTKITNHRLLADGAAIQQREFTACLAQKWLLEKQ